MKLTFEYTGGIVPARRLDGAQNGGKAPKTLPDEFPVTGRLKICLYSPVKGPVRSRSALNRMDLPKHGFRRGSGALSANSGGVKIYADRAGCVKDSARRFEG